MLDRPPKSIGRDRGLKARMAFTALLLVGLYVLLISLLVAAGAGVVATAATVGVLVLVHYLAGERLILTALGARPLDAGRMPELHDALERVCVLAERPMVRLALIDSALPTAYTIARSPLSATICVTSGLLELLDGPELDAVLAHELAHVASRNVVLVTLGGVFAALAAHLFALERRLLPRRGGAREEPRLPLAILGGLLFLVSSVPLQALSRHRQLAADRATCLLQSGSGALAGALRACSEAAAELGPGAGAVPRGELVALSLLAIDDPRTVATLFPSHPPLDLRLARLEAVSRELLAPA